MKKIVLCLVMLVSFLGGFYLANADESANEDGKVKVKISTNFELFLPDECHEDDENPGNYYCLVPKGMSGIEVLMGNMIKFFSYIASLAVVLFLVIGGIMYSMAGLDQGAKDNAKKLIVMVLSGLILLLLSGVVLKIVAPWVFK